MLVKRHWLFIKRTIYRDVATAASIPATRTRTDFRVPSLNTSLLQPMLLPPSSMLVQGIPWQSTYYHTDLSVPPMLRILGLANPF